MKKNRNWLQLFAEGEMPAAETAEAEAEAPAAEAADTEAPETVPEAVSPAGKYSALEPVLDALAQQLGVSAGDGEALARALRQRETRGKEVTESVKQGADRIYQNWMGQAEQLKQLYPDFDLRKEMADPRFAQLLRSRVDMQTAFEVLHNREIIPAAMEYAARTVEQRLANAMRSGTERPSENGIRSGGAVMLGSDASRMSRKDYAAVCRMVERGERVSFG